MSVEAVAERYAQAVFELAVAAGNPRNVADSLSKFAASYAADHNLRTALDDPTLPSARQQGVLVAVAQKCGVDDMGLRALKLMSQKRRLSVLPAMARKLEALVDEKEKIMRAEVITAQKLPESFYTQLTEQLSKVTGKKIRLDRREDPDIIGGAVARVGDAFIDGSVRGRLETLERQLTAALSAES